MKVRILHVLELLTAHPSEQLTTTLLKTLAMIRGSAQIPTQLRSHGLFHAFTQSLIPNESSEHVIVTLYTITSITSINKYLLKGFSLFYNAEQLNITP